MNRKTELVVSPVIDLVIAKWDIAYRQIKEVPPVRGFKASHRDIGFGIKLFGDSAGDGIQLHAVETAVSHALRHHAEEIANAHRRF